jgi:hypothetical protein
MTQRGMVDLLLGLETILIDEMKSPGYVDEVYFGYQKMATKTFRQDSAYLMFDAGGETDAPNKTGQTRNKRYQVILELGVKWTDSRESLIRSTTEWKRLEAVLFDPDLQHIELSPEVEMNCIRLFNVEDGFLFDIDNPAWRCRRGIALYDEIFCKRSWV